MKRGQKIIVPGDGTSLWTLTWNGDFAIGLVGLLGLPAAVGEAFHITSDEVLSWNQITREAGHAAGAEPDIVHIASDLIAAYNPGAVGDLIGDKSHSMVYDNSKIVRFVPDLKCEVTWAEGVRRSLAWFDADPARRTIDAEMNSQGLIITQARCQGDGLAQRDEAAVPRMLTAMCQMYSVHRSQIRACRLPFGDEEAAVDLVYCRHSPADSSPQRDHCVAASPFGPWRFS
jgi:hypothetical protein